MQRRLLLLALTCPLALALPAGAQLEFDEEPVVLGDDRFDGLPGSFGKAISGQLTNDRRVDVVQMFGDRPVLCYGPGTYHALIEAPYDANDLAIVEVESLNQESPGRGVLIIATDFGLVALTPDVNENSWKEIVLSTGEFANARAIDTGDLDGDGFEDIVALDADGTRLLVLYDPFSRGGGRYNEVHHLANAATGLLPLNWTEDAPLELALITNVGLRVVDRHANLVAAFQVGRAGDKLERLARPGQTDQVVATLRGNGGLLWLFVADASGAEPPIRLAALEAFQVAGLATGDIDRDGDEDLILSQTGNYQLWVLRNQSPAAPTFNLGPQGLALLTSGPAGAAFDNGATPVLDDLDEDGDLDLMIGVQAPAWLSIFRGRIVPHSVFAPRVSGGQFQFDETTNTGLLSLHVEEPQVPWPDATHLELVGWRQPGVQDRVRRTAFHHVFIPLDAP